MIKAMDLHTANPGSTPAGTHASHCDSDNSDNSEFI